jgi:hypothetical protein
MWLQPPFFSMMYLHRGHFFTPSEARMFLDFCQLVKELSEREQGMNEACASPHSRQNAFSQVGQVTIRLDPWPLTAREQSEHHATKGSVSAAMQSVK